MLERHRFAFPGEWLYAENVAGEWGAFSDIMKRKEANIQVCSKTYISLYLYARFLDKKIPNRWKLCHLKSSSNCIRPKLVAHNAVIFKLCLLAQVYLFILLYACLFLFITVLLLFIFFIIIRSYVTFNI